MNRHPTLAQLLDEDSRVLRFAGAHHPLSASLVQEVGFDGVWASSLEISLAAGVPDDEHVIRRHSVSAVREMNRTVSIPIIADCATGEPGLAMTTLVREMEGAGAAGLCLEDGRCPKINSLRPGDHPLENRDVFAARLETVLRARTSTDTRIIARVESLIAGLGVEDALLRAHAYADAGAHLILIHSKQKTPTAALAVVDRWDRPIPLVLVPTTYPQFRLADLATRPQVRVVIYANQGVRAAMAHTRRVLHQILSDGSTLPVESSIAPISQLFQWQDRTLESRRESRPATQLRLTDADRGNILLTICGDRGGAISCIDALLHTPEWELVTNPPLQEMSNRTTLQIDFPDSITENVKVHSVDDPSPIQIPESDVCAVLRVVNSVANVGTLQHVYARVLDCGSRPRQAESVDALTPTFDDLATADSLQQHSPIPSIDFVVRRVQTSHTRSQLIMLQLIFAEPIDLTVIRRAFLQAPRIQIVCAKRDGMPTTAHVQEWFRDRGHPVGQHSQLLLWDESLLVDRDRLYLMLDYCPETLRLAEILDAAMQRLGQPNHRWLPDVILGADQTGEKLTR